MKPDRKPRPETKALALAGVASFAIGAIVEARKQNRSRDDEPAEVELVDVQDA